MLKLCLITLLLISSSSLMAEEPAYSKGYSLPSNYPSNFHQKGILQGIDLNQRTLVIDGAPIKLDLNSPVHLLDLYNAILQNLKPGTPVGYTMRVQNGNELITEIWELPPKAVPLS
ncbi:hypothetical protein A9Q99_09140 [Gammaproteobacteria bacterium 45_16_T64]|nr:hypothetical protein A9Q99_09140 [Gammaproteobacteria bacterium 45_16_T64]